MKLKRITRQHRLLASEILDALRATGMKIPKRATLYVSDWHDKDGKLPIYVQWESKK